MLRRASFRLVAKLQRRSNRSSAANPVDKSVDQRWNIRGYAINGAAGGCFCCRFFAPVVCIKNHLPSPRLPTMLGVHQALEHKI
jgi:hypothetical protein